MQPPTVTDVQKASPHAATVLGYAVFWRLGGIKLLRSTLLSLLTRYGLASYLPDPPTAYAALRHALLAWMHEQWSQPLLLRTVSRHPLAFALVQEEAHQPDLDLSHTIRVRVLYDLVSQQLICTRTSTGPIDAHSEDQSLTARLSPFFQIASQTHEGTNLSRMVRSMITDLDAICLQRGVYFVPVSRRGELKQIDDLIQSIPGPTSPLLVTLERIDDLKTRQHLAKAIHADFLRELQTQEETMQQVLISGVPPTLKAVTGRLASFRALQNKAQVYADLLAERGAEITQNIERLQAQAQSLVLVSAESLIGPERPE